MSANEELISKFYSAFNNKDYATMQSFYHTDADFYDPVFENLNSQEVRAMWEMLLTSAKDLKVQCSEINANENRGSCRWDAWYTFTATGRPVHNIIHASFNFKDGKIISHYDDFDLWRWSRMALGISGLLLGWSSFVRNKVRKTAQGRLKKFLMERSGTNKHVA